MRPQSERLTATFINPFDKSYNKLQEAFDSKVLSLICSIMNLNLTLVNTPLVTNLSAYEKNPDIWIFEQIVNGSSEISATTIILTNETQNAVHFSFGVSTFRPQLYYKAKSLRDEGNIYWTPFSSEVWISIVIVFLLITIALTFILSREAELPHKISYDIFARLIDIEEDRDEEWSGDLGDTSEESLHQREKWELGEILLVCFGALCQQGSSRDPSTHAARILLIFLFILAAVFYTAYSASIISFISLFSAIEREHATSANNFSAKYNLILHDTEKIETDLKGI